MSEAKNHLLEGQPNESQAEAEAKVVLFPVLRARERPPPLTDEEVIQLRDLIQAFELISSTCPVARKILENKAD